MYNVNISNWRASGLQNSEVNCIWNHYSFSVSADFCGDAVEKLSFFHSKHIYKNRIYPYKLYNIKEKSELKANWETALTSKGTWQIFIGEKGNFLELLEIKLKQDHYYGLSIHNFISTGLHKFQMKSLELEEWNYNATLPSW